MAITKEMEDRVRAGRTGTSGMRNVEGGLFQRDQVPTQNMAMSKEMADRGGEGLASNNLGICHIHLGECAKAVAYKEAQRAWEQSSDLRPCRQSSAGYWSRPQPPRLGRSPRACCHVEC
jgi:hypothetical protein